MILKGKLAKRKYEAIGQSGEQNESANASLAALSSFESADQEDDSSSSYLSSSDEDTSSSGTSLSDSNSDGLKSEKSFNPISEYGIGASLLQKMGFKMGNGLGLKNQGITEPVQVDLSLKKGAGIGMNSLAWKRQEKEEFVIISDDDGKVLMAKDPVVFNKNIEIDSKQKENLINEDIIKCKNELTQLGIDSTVINELLLKGVGEVRRFLFKQKLQRSKTNADKLSSTKVDPEIRFYERKLFQIEKVKRFLIKLKQNQNFNYEESFNSLKLLDSDSLSKECDLILANAMFELKERITTDVRLRNLFCEYVLYRKTVACVFQVSKDVIYRTCYQKVCLTDLELFKVQVSLVVSANEDLVFSLLHDLPDINDAVIILEVLELDKHYICTELSPTIIGLFDYIESCCSNDIILQKQNVEILCTIVEKLMLISTDTSLIVNINGKLMDFLEVVLKKERLVRHLDLSTIILLSKMLEHFKPMICLNNIFKKSYCQRIEDRLYYEYFLKPNTSSLKELPILQTLTVHLDSDLKSTVIAESLVDSSMSPLKTLELMYDDHDLSQVEYSQTLGKIEKLTKMKQEKSKEQPQTVTNKGELVKACNFNGYVLDKIVNDNFNGPVYSVTNPENGLYISLIIDRNMMWHVALNGELTPITTDFRDIIKRLTQTNTKVSNP